LRFAKDTDIPVVIIGHVTKEGNIAGPRMLEHMVDVVLYFEGERNYHFRVLRVMKNRFGSTSETGIFGMDETGLTEVENPSALLLAERSDDQAGSVVIACMEGVRPLLVEVQALATPTVFGMPRRTAIGYDYNRLIILLAVLEKRIGLRLGTQDVYVNVIGGIKVTEPAADMAMALAITSSFRDLPIHRGTVVMGEVGLTGDIRMIPRVDMRIKEAIKMGFKRFIIPSGNKDSLKESAFSKCEIYGVRHILDAMDLALEKK
jgi:DNA repair protein RadA/Sms